MGRWKECWGCLRAREIEGLKSGPRYFACCDVRGPSLMGSIWSVVNCRHFSEAGRREALEVRMRMWKETSLALVQCLGTVAVFG